MEFIIQLAVVVICLIFGARKGGIGLGLAGGGGMLALVWFFGLRPGQPPVDVMLVIIAVVAASATLQASGGLDVLQQLAEKLLRRNPKYISLAAPLVTCLLTMLCGTGHVVYTLLPIIYDVAIKNNIRPERPLAASSIGSQMGIIASPVSVATVSLAAMLTLPGVSATIDFITLLSLTIPATLCGILAIAVFSGFRGKELRDDDAFLVFIDTKENHDYVYGTAPTLLNAALPRSSWRAMGVFIATIALITLLGAFPSLRPQTDGAPLSMVLMIQMCMLCGGACIVLLTGTAPAAIAKNDVFRSGMVAIVAVYGVAWMADTLFSNHLTQIEASLAGTVADQPWAYALVLLLLSQFVNSQAAALAAVVPIALAVGVPPALIAATAPACYGYYILPTYPSDLAAVQFDRAGTTRIGRWVINHSFLPVGLIGVGVSCGSGWLLAHAYGLM